MLVDEVLVGELRSIDRFATSTVSGGEIASLAHEPGDDPVELRSLVVQRLSAAAGSLLASAECSEVFSSAGSGVGEKLHHDPTGRHTADGHVKEDLRVCHRRLSEFTSRIRTTSRDFIHSSVPIYGVERS